MAVWSVTTNRGADAQLPIVPRDIQAGQQSVVLKNALYRDHPIVLETFKRDLDMLYTNERSTQIGI